MPCYDKKLEAVWPTEEEFKEVDSVLATHEIVDFLNLHSIDVKLLLDQVSYTE